MITVITYDIASPKRLIKMHKFLLGYGQNTQKSVFECDITLEQLGEIRAYAAMNLNLKKDSFRIYRICSTCIENEIILGKGLKVTNVNYQIF
ncbi:MAG: CRISPR-associated endonuclease Cas2 [Bdellovibrionota bacterium]